LSIQQRVMHINSSEVSTKNQLVMGGVTHKLIYMLKSINFINVGQSPLSHRLILWSEFELGLFSMASGTINWLACRL